MGKVNHQKKVSHRSNREAKYLVSTDPYETEVGYRETEDVLREKE
jgi:hypothetical protein